jgi:hypothetical protein
MLPQRAIWTDQGFRIRIQVRSLLPLCENRGLSPVPHYSGIATLQLEFPALMISPTPATNPVPISIILPVYNVAEYLPECLQSIIDQSFEFNIEALLVEDCSTDHSLQICKDFADRHSDLSELIANAENRGVSVARNVGLDNARGDFFMFVDPDNVLPEGALQNLYSAATKNDVDIVKGNNTIFNEHGEHNARYNVSSESLVTGVDVLTTLYDHSRVRGHPWGRLFNRERLGGVRFPVGVRMAQDLYYCGKVFGTARSLLLIDKPVIAIATAIPDPQGESTKPALISTGSIRLRRSAALPKADSR